MVGQRDLITPIAHAEALVAAISDAELVVIPDAGHLLVLERPREVGEQVWSLITRVNPPKLVHGTGPVHPRVGGKRIEKPKEHRGKQDTP